MTNDKKSEKKIAKRIEKQLHESKKLLKKGIEVISIDRGGDVTYHGPGQLVGYPILPLGPISAQDNLPKSSYIEYIRSIEHTLIQALAKLGLASGQLQGLSGVWVQPDVASRCAHCPPAAKNAPSKIAAIGVKVDARGVSRHGFALNVTPDMSYWEGIIGCGLEQSPVIGMADLLPHAPNMADVMARVTSAFGRVFDYHMVPAALSPPSAIHNLQ